MSRSRLNLFTIGKKLKETFVPPPKPKEPYMMNTKQRESFNKKAAEIKTQRQETFSRQAIAGIGTVLAGGYISGKTKNQPGEGTVLKPTTTTTTSTTREPVSQPKVDFVPWRERKFPTDLSARKDDGVAKGVTQRSFVSDSKKGITYKDVRSGRATAMQESKSRFERAQKAKQSKRIDAEMRKAPTPQAPRSVMDFKPDFQASANYFDSFKKSTAVSSPNPRAEVDTESYQPRPGTRMGIGKYESKRQKPEEVKASMPAPTKKPVRSDYPDTSSYMAAYGEYRRALMAGKL